MGLKNNFKKTSIGIIPKDWSLVKLGDVADIKSGGTPSTINKNFWNGHIPWCIPTDITKLKGAKYLIETNKKITNLGLKKSSAELIPSNSIIMTSRATIGECAINKHPVATNQGFKNFIPKSQIDTDFLFYLLQSKKADFLSLSVGSTFLEISKAKLINFFINIPESIKEQRAIAKVLNNVDDLIVALEKLIDKKKMIKKGMMQELLTGKKRLPGFDGEWDNYKIKEFTLCVAGGTPSTIVDEYWNGKVRWMSSGELNNKFVYDVTGRITELGLKNSSASIVPENCVLIGLAGQGKTRGTVAINFISLSTNQSIAAIFPNKKFLSLYLYYNLDNRYEELRELSSGGGGRGGLNLGIINNILIPFPKSKEQKAIAKILFDMDCEINALEVKLKKIRNIKKGMIQQLLTGRIRLV